MSGNLPAVGAAPTVSIITPTFNRERMLRETIESILSQSFQDFEYIVVDDGSTDATRDLVADYGGRIVYLHHENRGEAASVNRGWSVARGRYVAVVSSDDPVLPGWLAGMVERMEARPDVVVAYPDWQVIDDGGQVLQRYSTFEYDFVHMVSWLNTFPGPGTFIRRAAFAGLQDLRNPNYRYISDLECWLRLALRGPFMRVPVELATWRTHGQSITVADRSRARADEMISLVREYFARRDLPPEIAAARRYAYSRAHWIAAWVLEETSPIASVRHLRKSYALAPNEPPGMPRILFRYPRPTRSAYFGAYRAWRAAQRRATKPRLLVDLRDNATLRGFHTLAAAMLLRPKLGSAEWTAIVGRSPDERLAFDTFAEACGQRVEEWTPGATYDLYIGVASAWPEDPETRSAMPEAKRTILALTRSSGSSSAGAAELDGDDTAAVAQAALAALETTRRIP